MTKLAMILAGAMATGLVGGCTMTDGGATNAAPTAGAATADLRTAAGVDVGRAVVREEGGKLSVTVTAMQMPPGVHGVHVHTVGRCDAPDFATAGGHWNPGAMKHGSMNPAGPHAGDLPNLTIGADGKGTLTMALPSGTIDGLFDADGSALVVHATADDLMTDPSGNSGGRIACGVLTRG